MVNLAFGGTTLASINTGSQNGGSDDAFNGDPASKWHCWNSTTGWIQYDFGANNAQTVKRYTINSADVPARDPRGWQFQGSQDGSSWTTLDTQSNQSFLVVMAQNTYNIGNTTAYRYYRLNITANNGDAYSVAIGDLGLWSDVGRIIPDGRYNIFTRKGIGKVIDVQNGGTANGSKLHQWGYLGVSSQKWDVAYQGNGQYRVTGVGSGRVMDLKDSSTANGATIHIWDWVNANNQKWTITPADDGSFKFLNVSSGKSLDVQNNSTADGALILQYSYISGDNQQWRLRITP
jgi:hypothetical protein